MDQDCNYESRRFGRIAVLFGERKRTDKKRKAFGRERKRRLCTACCIFARATSVFSFFFLSFLFFSFLFHRRFVHVLSLHARIFLILSVDAHARRLIAHHDSLTLCYSTHYSILSAPLFFRSKYYRTNAGSNFL